MLFYHAKLIFSQNNALPLKHIYNFESNLVCIFCYKLLQKLINLLSTLRHHATDIQLFLRVIGWFLSCSQSRSGNCKEKISVLVPKISVLTFYCLSSSSFHFVIMRLSIEVTAIIYRKQTWVYWYSKCFNIFR